MIRISSSYSYLMDPNVVNAVVEDGRASSQDLITAYALAHTQSERRNARA
jgi:hypothetical protein